MANVADSNFWRPIPLSDSVRETQTPAPQAPSFHHGGADGWLVKSRAAADPSSEMAELSMALRHLFDGPRDRVEWSLSAAGGGPAINEQLPPLDSLGAAETLLTNAVGASLDAVQGASERRTSKPWLVVVVNAGELTSDRVEQVQRAIAQSPRLVVVACDTDPSGIQSRAEANIALYRRAAELGDRLHVQSIGPIADRDLSQLVEALARIKELDRPALLYVKTHDAPLSAAAPSTMDLSVAQLMGESIVRFAPSMRHVANSELAQLARDDSRIVSISTATDATFARAWETTPQRMFLVESGVPYALQWCADLALNGSRPFAFLSCEEAQNSFGQIRQDICLRRAPVTMILESRRDALDGEAASSASLAGIRQLPHTCLLAPKNAMEVREMITWCASQNGPAVIWLPENVEPRAVWQPGPDIALGRAEQLTEGNDVAIIAWGPMVASACAAAETLAQLGVRAAVLNARFAQPLDIEALARVTRGALCTVIVNDGDNHGGFSSWVLDELLGLGTAQNVSVVSPNREWRRQHSHQVHDECAARIVERCRWLGERIETQSQTLVEPVAGIVPSGATAPQRWLAPQGLAVSEVHDEQGEIQAQQFTPLVDDWVRRYSNVGARDVYLWRWCLHGLGLITLSCAPPRLRQDLCDTKLLAVMYGVMLDDIADQGGEEDFLTELANIIRGVPPDFSRFSSRQQAYARFTDDLWKTFESRLKCLPCYDEYKELLEYDHQQILNTMSYSSLVNRCPALLNVQEHDMYLPHNMQMLSFATMDLMASPDFDRRELGKLREVIWHAQSMGRIGNLVSTWQREVGDRDFTSGVFARALCQGDITLEDLRSAPPGAIAEAICNGGHEFYFLQKWEFHRASIEALGPRIHSVDVGALLMALQRLLHMELGSRGFK